MKSLRILCVILLFCFFTNNSFAIVLDRGGTGPPTPPPPYYTCTQVKLKQAQGANNAQDPEANKPFSISLTALCALHPSEGLPGWTPLTWQEVTVSGRHYYGTQQTEETVYLKGQVAFQVHLSCSKNPWAHGTWVGGQTCSTTSTPTNNTGAIVNGPFPLSAKYMDYSLQSAIAKAEKWISPEDMLQDWNPYEQTGGTTSLIIQKPSNNEMINQGIGTYTFLIDEKPNTQNLGRVKFQIERLEETPEMVGDIKLPETITEWWQSFWQPSFVYTSSIPIGISNGMFANQSGQYRLRARGFQSYPNSQTPVGGWTMWRNFCIGAPGENCNISNGSSINTNIVKKMESVLLLLDQSSHLNELDKAKKEKVLFTQILTQKPALTPMKNYSPPKKKSLIKKDVLKEKASKRLMQEATVVSLESSRDSGKVLTLNLKNSGKVALNKASLELKSLKNNKVLWSLNLSINPGKKQLLIAHKDMNLKTLSRGTSRCDLFINGQRIGAVNLLNRTTFAKTGISGLTSESPSARKLNNTTLKKGVFLLPQLKIDLSLRTRTLKAGNKASIIVSVKNYGKGKLAATESFSLQCTAECPFSKKTGKLNMNLNPGNMSTLILTTKSLKTGDYDVMLKTRYGTSRKLTFSVKPKVHLQRVPTNGTSQPKVNVPRTIQTQ